MSAAKLFEAATEATIRQEIRREKYFMTPRFLVKLWGKS
jgi:hypothetical protein